MTPFAGDPFDPPAWLQNRHWQTILSQQLPRRLPGLASQRRAWRRARQEVLFELPDGDRLLAFMHLQTGDPRRRRPVVLHLHGLEGHADSDVQRSLSCKAFACGFHSVRLNFRNCGRTEYLARDLYYGSRTDDLAAVIGCLSDRWGFERIAVTGVSLGGNMLLRYLGDPATNTAMLLGACAISAPVEMAQALEAFSQGSNWIYERYFLTSLKAKLRRKARLSPDGTRLLPYVARLAEIRTLAQWDEQITAPLGGYQNAMAYYASGSAGPHLGRIRVPTLLVHAQDDPFIPFAMFEQHAAAIAGNPALATLFPPRGGHVGFWARRRGPERWMDHFWAENQAIAFLAARAGERSGL
ncbi:MAG: alpha/beta fold hydrolase [Cyanobacteria bacterium REEB65]|nr:alpha/beta fold hydrolase [Cyanobacteria bacterium REEB65]